ncbi:MAG TPA: YdcF family protein [Candidatus Paceibacterota bacterium]|nr:YdcF family protein [Candidatus Paceibacterota bacterium]
MTNEELTRYIFMEESPEPRGDVAFVFGTHYGWQESCARAAELYLAGFVPKILTTGGNKGESWKEPEGRVMADELVRLGVKRSDIVIEDKSTNTLENVTMGREALDRAIGLENVRTIVAVAKEFHSRRTLMTLARHMPARMKYKVALYTSPYLTLSRRHNWTETDEGRKKITGEFEKIRKYLDKGDLAEI